MRRTITGAIFLMSLILFPLFGCQKNAEMPVETGPQIPQDIAGVYRGVKTMEVGKTRITFDAEMKIGGDNRVESLYWQDVRNLARTDEIWWTAKNTCEFVRTHYDRNRAFQQVQEGEVRIRRKQSRLEMSVHLPLAQEITKLNFEYEYPPGAVDAYEIGGQLNWDSVNECLTAKVFAVIPPIPATAMPTGSFAIAFGKSRILKVIPGPRAMATGPDGGSRRLGGKKPVDFKRVQLTHAPGTWFIDAFNVDALVDRQGVIETPDTSYAVELVDLLRWEATVNICADGRNFLRLPDYNQVWEMQRQR